MTHDFDKRGGGDWHPLPPKHNANKTNMAAISTSVLTAPVTADKNPNKYLTLNNTKSITILQCNIGGAPYSRLAHGSTLRKYIIQHRPTFIVLTETKRTRKDIPTLPKYGHYTLNPLAGSSGGIVFYYQNFLRYRVSKARSSAQNSILWVYVQHHKSPCNDLYIGAVYAVQSCGPADRKESF